jgi:hypothetical protein
MADQKLIDKLRLEKYPNKLVLNLPEFVDELDSLVFDRVASRETYDLVLAFVLNLEEMATVIHQVEGQNLLVDEGLLYLVYPKKGNKVYPQFIGRDDIFPYLHVNLDTGLVENTQLKFNTMVAFNDTFTTTGLKKLGAKTFKTAQAGRESQSSNLYVDQLPALEQWLEVRPEVLAFFRSLTPGYQKDWARYVYSAKTAATVEKRLLETADILAQGYKSITLYRQDRE